MPIAPHILPEEQLKTSNVLMLLYVYARRFKDVSDELTRVNADANIATARQDVIEARWGHLLSFEFNPVFTLEKYRSILLGLIKANLVAPTNQALMETVKAFVPNSVITLYDYWHNPSNFVGPTPDTFFKWNDITSTNNKWNTKQNIWAPNKLLRELGFTPYGTQVHVSINDPSDVDYLRFIPQQIKVVKPAHVLVALVSTQEVVI